MSCFCIFKKTLHDYIKMNIFFIKMLFITSTFYSNIKR